MNKNQENIDTDPNVTSGDRQEPEDALQQQAEEPSLAQEAASEKLPENDDEILDNDDQSSQVIAEEGTEQV